MGSSVLNFLLIGTDAGASRAIARVGAAATATSKEIEKASDKQAAAAARVNKAFNAVGKASALITIGIGIAGVKAAVDFESALTRVSTQAGVSKDKLKGLGDALLKLSPKVGFNPEDLATSLYHVESAFESTGISAKNALAIVEQASKLARIGNANLEDTTQAIVGVLASRIKGVRDAADAAAQLNQIVGAGDTNLETVAKAIGSGILPTAQTLGLSFKDVGAALATLTDNVTPADEAATRLRTTLSLVGAQSPKEAAALSGIGLSTTQLAEDFRKPNGLLVAMQDLRGHLNAVYPLQRTQKLTTDQVSKATQSYVTQLETQGVQQKVAIDLGKKYETSLKNGGTAASQQAKIILDAFGGARSGSTFLTLFNELDRLQSKYQKFGTSAQAAAKFQSAWVQTQATAKQKLAELDASWHVFLVQVGNAILPDLKKVLDVLAKHPQAIQNVVKAIAIFAGAWAAVKVASIVAALGRIATAFLGVATAAGTAATAEAGAATAAAGVGARAGLLGGAAVGALPAASAAAGTGTVGRYAISAAGGRGLALGAAGKILLPVAITIVGIKSAQNALKTLKDLGEHQYGKALTDGLNNAVLNGLTFGISGGIAKAIKSGDWVKALGPGAGLIQKALGGALPGGKLTGELAKDFGKATGLAKNFWGTLDDRVRIAQFQASLQNASSLLNSNTNSLQGNSAGAKSNREGLTQLVVEAEAAAHAYANTTGKQSDYTAALRLAIPQIEDAAAATGLNRGEVEKLVTAILGVPLETENSIKVNGYLEALNNVNTFLASLAQIPAVVRVPIETFIASPTPANQLAGSAFGVDTVGRHAAGGVARGWSLVGERGPELMHVGSPSRVLTNGETMAALAPRASGGVTVNLTVNALDPKSVTQPMRAAWAKEMAIEIKRAQGQGFTLN